MPDFFDQLTAFESLDASSAPDPLESVPPHLKWLKNTLAQESKSRYIEDDLFNPENTHLTTDEYTAKVVREKEQAELAKQNAERDGQINEAMVKLNSDAMLSQINQARQILGQAPLLPDKADLQDPNNAQALISAIGALMFPQFAFDIAAAPFKHQLNEQARQQELNNQAHAETVRRAQMDANMALAAGETEQRVNELNFQANLNREVRQDEQDFQKELIGINFGNALTMEASGFAQQLKVLDLNQKHQLGMFFLGNALDPNVGPEVRAAANAKLKSMGIEIAPVQGSSAAAGVASGLGIDPKQLAGMTLPELQHFVGISLMLSDEKRKAELFPEQKTQLENQGKLLSAQVPFASSMARLQYDLGVMSLRNTQSEIDHRTWMQNYNTDEQQRLRIGMIGTMYQGSIDALKLQIASNSSIIEANAKIITDALASDDAKKAAQKQNDELTRANTDLLGALGSLNDDYMKLADDIRSQTGLDVKGTNNGESFLGTPYAWGGGTSTGPSKGIGKGAETTGFDCSGFTKAVANLDYGVSIPRTAEAQWRDNKGMSTVSDGESKIEDARMGDFLYFRDGNNWHTGILVYRDGIAYIRHAPQTGAVVRDDLLGDFLKTTKKKLVGIKRVYKPDPYTIVPKGALEGGR